MPCCVNNCFKICNQFDCNNLVLTVAILSSLWSEVTVSVHWYRLSCQTPASCHVDADLTSSFKCASEISLVQLKLQTMLNLCRALKLCLSFSLLNFQMILVSGLSLSIAEILIKVCLTFVSMSFSPCQLNTCYSQKPLDHFKYA